MTGYFKFFQEKETDNFIEGTTFKQVFDLYIFDRKLRLLTLDAIEKIEVSLKANISDYMSNKFGIFWYAGNDNFHITERRNNTIYEGLVKKLNKIKKHSRSIFVKEYFRKHDEEHLPSWMLFEELTIGELSNIYRLIKVKSKQEIADLYGIYQLDLQLWIKLLVNIRNISAHHSRLWNKEYIVTLRRKDTTLGNEYSTAIIDAFAEKKEVIPNYYNAVLVIKYLLKSINKDLGRFNDLRQLFDDYPGIPKDKMGFKGNWEEKFE